MNPRIEREWRYATVARQIYIWSPGANGLFPIGKGAWHGCLFAMKNRYPLTKWEQTIFDMMMSGF